MSHRTKPSRIAALLALSFGAALLSGCANWGERRTMGAGPEIQERRAGPGAVTGPRTVAPSGTTAPTAPSAVPGPSR